MTFDIIGRAALGIDMLDMQHVSIADALGPLNQWEKMQAPQVVHYAGDLGLLGGARRVAIVGNRDASSDGLRRASQLARDLVSNEVIVVSGLARGIDTAAHRAAISNGGRTIAVLGTPLDRCSPVSNRELQEQICLNHLAISQFPPGTATQPHHFVMRNRLMALVSDASIIIEAGETSGSLSQGWETLRLGRPLFLAQSLVDKATLSWPRKMIDHGAIPLREVGDIFEYLRPPGASPLDGDHD